MEASISFLSVISPAMPQKERINGLNDRGAAQVQYPIIFVPGMLLDLPENFEKTAGVFLKKYTKAKKGRDYFIIDNDQSNPVIADHLSQAKNLNRKVNSLKSEKVNLVFFSNSYFTFLKYLVESGIVTKTAAKYVFKPEAAKKINRVVLFSPSPEGSFLANKLVDSPLIGKAIFPTVKVEDKRGEFHIPVNYFYKDIIIPYKIDTSGWIDRPVFGELFKNLRHEDEGYLSPLVKEARQIFAALPLEFRQKIALFMGSESLPLQDFLIPGSDEASIKHSDIFVMTEDEEVEIKDNAPVLNENFKGVNAFYAIGCDHGCSRELTAAIADIFYDLMITNEEMESRAVQLYDLDPEECEEEDDCKDAYRIITPSARLEEIAVTGEESAKINLTGNHIVSLEVLLYLCEDKSERVREAARAAVDKRIRWNRAGTLESLEAIGSGGIINVENEEILSKNTLIQQAAKFFI